MKKCTGCLEEKSVEDFGMKKGKRNARCKTCINAYYNDLYHNRTDRKSTQMEYIKANQERYRIRNREWLWLYLEEHPCITCGESDPIVLDFDHLDPELKSYGVGELASHGWSLDRLQEEIDKCVVLCSNCHRKRTAKQFNYWRHERSSSKG